MNEPGAVPALPLARLLTHAADAVQAVASGESLTTALARCPAEARAGTQALAFHTLRWLGAARAARNLLASKAPPPALDALLWVALALLWPQVAPPYAEHTVVDQAVAAARLRAPRSAAFVNAVLRRFLREREAIVASLADDPVARHNHPRWWIERLRKDWPAQWQAVLHADDLRAPMTLRVNTRHGSSADYIERLKSHGIAAQALGAQAVMLEAPCPVGRLPGFADGDISVQDAAAQRAAPLLVGAGLRPGARVLDACAAPGGKTAHLLELADSDLLALDSDPARLVRVRETLTRLHLQARCVAGDAGDPAAWWDGQPFDAILLDAPCSGSGVVRRHPDIRWLRRAGDIDALAAGQARLLDALWPLLAPGGRLLYATCSVFKAEGQAVIDAFLQRRPDAAPAREPAAPGHLLPLPDNDHGAEAAASGFSLAADGFFYFLIERT
ncbi:MAG: 16S rRNA (cytosine(967)-C(5))-methyltransferase RsmB [Burkholderiaceae bacterium]